LIEVDQERAGYQRQQARDKITEEEFDARMDETENDKKYWQDELDRLTELKDDAEKIQSGLDYVTELMTTLQERLTEIDIPLDELKALPQEGQNEILEKRRKLSERYATGF
jgi:archaellum component FlaC